MPRQRTVLDVFVASPGDTHDERSRLDVVAAELNRATTFQLDLIKWETHARPAAGRPQQVVFDTTTRTPDILIGVFRQRLGTPTGVADSGTVEEIENALSFWQQFQQGRGRRIEIMLYFKRPPYDVHSEADHEQLGQVLRFRQRVSKELLVWEYDDTDEFEASVRGHLTKLVQDWSQVNEEDRVAETSAGRSHWGLQLERSLRALGEVSEPEPLEQDAVQYIRMAASRPDHGIGYDELVGYCDELLLRVQASRRVEVLVLRADIERLAGRWQSAYSSLLEASDAARKGGSLTDETEVLRHIARITWEHGLLSRDLADRCERLLQQLPTDMADQRALVSSILADRLAYVPGAGDRRYQLAADATARVEEILDPGLCADILLPARQALYDREPISTLYEYAVRVERIGRELGDVHLISEGLGAQIVDLLRQRNITGVRATLKRHRQLCGVTQGKPQLFRQLTIEGLIALAEGRFDSADERAGRARGVLSGIVSTEDNAASDDVIAAQAGWCLYERGDERLGAFVRRLVQRLGEGVPGSEDVWRLAVALAYLDIGDAESSVSIFHEVVRTTNRFQVLERGLFRIGILALGAEVLWALGLARGVEPELRDVAQTIIPQLEAHGDDGILIGFPAVFLGDKRRFLGLARACVGDLDEAGRQLRLAARWSANAGLRAHEARCAHDQAQIVCLAFGGSDQAEPLVRRSAELAEELGMLRLAQRPLEYPVRVDKS